MKSKTITGRYNPELTRRLQGLVDAAWTDYPNNPVVEPLQKGLIADPTVVTPSLSPDGQWHMITCGGGHKVHQWSSPDGISWTHYAEHVWNGFSPYIYPLNGKFYLFYQINGNPERCWLVMRETEDLKTWSEAKVILEPDLPWEDEEYRPTCRNACVVKDPEGGFRLYYSGGVRLIPDLGFEEPANIGVAYADSIGGPYTKRPEPLFIPDKEDPYRNIGAGAMKVYYLEAYELYLGFNNGVYRDADGHSRSCINILLSEDGLDWYDTLNNPILAPEPGWKSALVYQLCLAVSGDKWHLYYNAREGWEVGVERIGLATAPLNGIDPKGIIS